MIIINEGTESYKSFQDVTPGEIKKYRNQWKVGDTRVESSGATYVIIDISSRITVMRTDLVSKMCQGGGKDSIKYIGSIMDNYLVSNTNRILGNTFSKVVKPRSIESDSRLVWLPSASEVFGSETITIDKVKKDGRQFEYFKKKENRRLGSAWWTRSGFWYSGYASFVICSTDGSQSGTTSYSSYGLAPCFYI